MSNPYHASAVAYQPNSKNKLMHSLFSLSGRAPRRTFWLGTFVPPLALGGLVLVTVIALGVIGPRLPEWAGMAALVPFMLAYAIVTWISIAVQVKRWHDRGKSGWWYLINLVPFGGLWAFIECGGLRGTVGPNRFGLDITFDGQRPGQPVRHGLALPLAILLPIAVPFGAIIVISGLSALGSSLDEKYGDLIEQVEAMP